MNYGAGKSKFYAASDSNSHASVSKLPATNQKKDGTLYLSRLHFFRPSIIVSKIVFLLKKEQIFYQIFFMLIYVFFRSTFYNDQVLPEEPKTDLRSNIDAVS